MGRPPFVTGLFLRPCVIRARDRVKLVWYLSSPQIPIINLFLHEIWVSPRMPQRTLLSRYDVRTDIHLAEVHSDMCQIPIILFVRTSQDCGSFQTLLSCLPLSSPGQTCSRLMAGTSLIDREATVYWLSIIPRRLVPSREIRIPGTLVPASCRSGWRRRLRPIPGPRLCLRIMRISGRSAR